MDVCHPDMAFGPLLLWGYAGGAVAGSWCVEGLGFGICISCLSVTV